MLGAIIGDLAASQWQLDKNAFYKFLVTDEAKATEYGVEVMFLTPDIVNKKPIDEHFFANALTPPYSQGHLFSAQIDEWSQGDFLRIPYNRVRGVLAITAGMIGWTSERKDEIEIRLSQLNIFGINKEDWYATRIMARAVFDLKVFGRKDLISSSSNNVYDLLKSWNIDKMGLLADVTRAWKCFETSFDFTSAIHNAVKSKINPHLTAALAGMFAEAAYGCRYVFLKCKYTGIVGYRNCIQIPEHLKKFYGYRLFEQSMLEYNKELKTFHKKNCSETDVEIHSWSETINAYQEIHISNEMYDRIFYGFDTDEANPYGFYWDDGKFYLYGKDHLFARFEIAEDRLWNRIIHFETTGSVHDAHIAMNAALHSIFHSDYLFKDMPKFEH